MSPTIIPKQCYYFFNLVCTDAATTVWERGGVHKYILPIPAPDSGFGAPIVQFFGEDPTEKMGPLDSFHGSPILPSQSMDVALFLLLVRT